MTEKTISVATGEFAVGKANEIITTGSVGSCVVIILYDADAKVGGLAHAMLPSIKDHSDESNEVGIAPAKYVDDAICKLVASIEGLGGSKEKLKAKLVGGAVMFQKLINEKNSIGFKNIESARKTLAQLAIMIDREDTGGNCGKIVELSLDSGIVDVHSKL